MVLNIVFKFEIKKTMLQIHHNHLNRLSSK